MDGVMLSFVTAVGKTAVAKAEAGEQTAASTHSTAVSIGTLLSWCKCTTSKIVLLEITRTLAVLSLEPATVGLMTAEGGGKVDLAGVAGPGEAAAVLVELCLRFTDTALADFAQMKGADLHILEHAVTALTNLTTASTAALAHLADLRTTEMCLSVVHMCSEAAGHEPSVHTPGPQAQAQNEDYAAVSRAAMSLLWVLTIDPASQDKFHASGGAAIILKAANTAGPGVADELIQSCFGILRLMTLEDSDSQNRQVFVDLGAIEAALEALRSAKAADTLEQIAGFLGNLADDDKTHPALGAKQVLAGLAFLLKPVRSSARRTSLSSAEAPKRYRSMSLVKTAASTVASIVVGNLKYQVEACRLGLPRELIAHVHRCTVMEDLVPILVTLDVIIRDNHVALSNFCQDGGLEAVLDTLSRAADESVLEESLRILSFVFHDHVARSQVTQELVRLHYDVVGLLKHAGSIARAPANKLVAKDLLAVLATIMPKQKTSAKGPRYRMQLPELRV